MLHFADQIQRHRCGQARPRRRRQVGGTAAAAVWWHSSGVAVAQTVSWCGGTAPKDAREWGSRLGASRKTRRAGAGTRLCVCDGADDFRERPAMREHAAERTGDGTGAELSIYARVR